MSDTGQIIYAFGAKPPEDRPPLRFFKSDNLRPVCEDKQLNDNLGACMEQAAKIVRDLSERAAGLRHRTLAQSLENMSELLETHAARLPGADQ